MKIAILTTFQDFYEGYSLTGIVRDQIIMLKKYGHDVTVFACEHFNEIYLTWFSKEKIPLKLVLPFSHLHDYQSTEDIKEHPEHAEIIDKTQAVLEAELDGFDVVFVHDIAFQGWHYPYCEGLIKASRKFPKVPFMHWIHSIPSGCKDIWNIQRMGVNHKLIFPNETDALRIAEQFRGRIDDVRVVPHIKDLRTFFDFSDDTCRFIEKYPAIMQHELVMVLPASTDKLSSKGIDEAIKIMGFLKNMMVPVCLVIVNQFCSTTQPKESLEPYKKLASKYGLEPDKDFIFTSEFEPPNFEIGCSKRMVRELMMLSNLLIYATKCESFGLIMPEASLAGDVLLVLNASLPMLREVNCNNALWFDFGSCCQMFETEDMDKYCQQIAWIIKGHFIQNRTMLAKTFHRTKHNMDFLYNSAYMPVMTELIYRYHENVSAEVAYKAKLESGVPNAEA